MTRLPSADGALCERWRVRVSPAAGACFRDRWRFAAEPITLTPGPARDTPPPSCSTPDGFIRGEMAAILTQS